MTTAEQGGARAMGARFTDARVAAGLSQSEAARRAGVSRSAVIRSERGCRGMRGPTITALAQTYVVAADWLLGVTP